MALCQDHGPISGLLLAAMVRLDSKKEADDNAIGGRAIYWQGSFESILHVLDFFSSLGTNRRRSVTA